MKKFVGVLIGFVSTIFANTPEASLDMATQATSGAIISGAVSHAFSDSQMPSTLSKEKPLEKSAFYYVRFAAAESNLVQMNSILPGLGVGYRRLTGNGAADISINGIGILEHKNERVLWNAPKTSYIRPLSNLRFC